MLFLLTKLTLFTNLYEAKLQINQSVFIFPVNINLKLEKYQILESFLQITHYTKIEFKEVKVALPEYP